MANWVSPCHLTDLMVSLKPEKGQGLALRWAPRDSELIAVVNLQYQGPCTALDAHDHHGRLLTHFTDGAQRG